jgi:hypothetical protein
VPETIRRLVEQLAEDQHRGVVSGGAAAGGGAGALGQHVVRVGGDVRGHAEARDVLAPIYGWFTKGFNTADLNEAKALLDGLT